MKELIELIAKSLVDNLNKVQVSQLDGEQSSIIELKVAPEDLIPLYELLEQESYH